MIAEENAFQELCCYTLSLRDAAFIHQHVVDAFAVQRADERTKPIQITFGLVGLYLHVEKQVSGRDVQRIHMLLARRKQAWPVFALPVDRGAITVVDVLAAAEGLARVNAIDTWCGTVWEAFRDSHQAIADLANRELCG